MNPLKKPLHWLVPIAAVLWLLILYFMFTLYSFGSPLAFALGILAELSLLIVIIYGGLAAFKRPVRIVKSIALSAWRGILNNRYVKRFEVKEAPLLKWLGRRLDPHHPFGLTLTIGGLLGLFFMLNFITVSIQSSQPSQLTAADIRIVNLAPDIRTHFGISFFRFITFWGNWQTIYALTLGLAAYFASRQKRLTAGWLIGSLALYEIGVNLIKQVVDRPRPPLSIIPTDSLSFPSGHVLAAIIIYGLLAYILFRSLHKHISRLAVLLGFVLLIGLIGLSRIYLGAHYPSDALAAMWFGLLILTLLIVAAEMLFDLKLIRQAEFKSKGLVFIPLVVAAWSLLLSPTLVPIQTQNVSRQAVQINDINAATIPKLPLYSETLYGNKMEPISFMLVGSRAKIVDLFTTHGWYLADQTNLGNALKAIAVGLQNRQYLNAPVSPAYLNAQPEDLAFEQPSPSHSVRQRHHIRLWQTDFDLPGGRPVWVATASFDAGVKAISNFWLPNHTIDPNIDAERAYIINSLDIVKPPFFQVVPPQIGHNAGGDQFFTDGRAALINL